MLHGNGTKTRKLCCLPVVAIFGDEKIRGFREKEYEKQQSKTVFGQLYLFEWLLSDPFVHVFARKITIILGYLSTGAICSEKRPLFTQRSWRKTVNFEEYVQNITDKYPCIFYHQTRLVCLLDFFYKALDVNDLLKAFRTSLDCSN